MPADVPAAEVVEVTRVHPRDGTAIVALEGASLTVASGEIVAVMGPSGSGKSTLLFLLAGLDRPDRGRALVAGVDWESLSGRERARFRRRSCGFVAQGLALLPQATAAENVEVPLLLDGVDHGERADRVASALERVGLLGEATKLPDQLSGGQQQRVAIARALVAEPAVILADEPTGNLDSATGQDVTRLLVDATRERDAAVVLVTHDPQVARHADRLVEIHSGHLSEPAVSERADAAS
jgi:putative ABC transport system ATP-binding protein